MLVCLIQNLLVLEKNHLTDIITECHLDDQHRTSQCQFAFVAAGFVAILCKDSPRTTPLCLLGQSRLSLRVNLDLLFVNYFFPFLLMLGVIIIIFNVSR